MLIRHSLLKFGKHQLAFNNKWVYKNFSNKINDDFQIKSTGFSKVATPQEAKVNLTEKFKIKLMDKEEKERRSQILKREITDNPEFFNAFPHLKQIVKREDMEDNQVDIQKHISDNYFIKEEDKNKDIKQKKSSYFESLLGSYKSYEDVLKTDRGDIDNVNTFAEGYKSLSGPMKYMSKREKEAVHLEIDKKLQELEDTGLSREEILYDKPEGTPLKEDKFFQYVKNNKIAREILVKPSETFTSDLIVEKILKQDIGPDGSLALKHKNFKFGDDMPAYYEVSKYKQHYSPKNKDSILQEDDFDYKTNYLDKLKLQVGSDRAKPVSFVNPPMAKSELRKKFMIKTIKKKDITWKNLPLLVRFVNEGGKLLNKYQTRLPTAIHRKLTKTVKHARNMGLLPFTDFVKPYHKVPFTSLYNEFAHDTSKVVDKNTGIIKVVHQPSEKDKYTYSSYDSAVEAESHYSAGKRDEQFKNNLLLDTAEIPMMPSMQQRDLLMAQNYLVKFKNGSLNENALSLIELQEKSSYEKIINLLTNRITPASIIDSFLSEKSYSFEDIRSQTKYFVDLEEELKEKVESVLQSKITKEKSDTVDVINDVIIKYNLDFLKPVDYEKEFIGKDNYHIEPSLNTRHESLKIGYKNYSTENKPR